MQRMTVTLMNMYDTDTTLLDEMALPTQVNRDDFLGRLMIDVGESEVCITNPRIMKIAIGVWSRGKLPMWNKLAAILDYDYHPIWNVDGETVHTGSNSNDRTYGRERGQTIETEEDSTTTGYISADNSENWSNDTKTDYDMDRSEELEETISDTEKQKGSDTWTDKRTGNIGVTTTQQMMREEKDFWENYDIVGYIINQFAHEFLLLVY